MVHEIVMILISLGLKGVSVEQLLLSIRLFIKENNFFKVGTVVSGNFPLKKVYKVFSLLDIKLNSMTSLITQKRI